jgi:hypothetical protein
VKIKADLEEMETEVDIFEERLNKIDIEDFEGI